MTPYFHTTTLVAVDDDPVFLESLAFTLARDIRCEVYDSPADALEAVRGRAGLLARARSLLAPLSPEDMQDLPGDTEDRAVRLRMSRILALAGDAERHRQISTVLVDYDMPGMDGLAFCRALGDLPVLKILLTGKADAGLAVAAFNEGIIDRFVLKQDPDVRQRLRAEVRDGVRRYFRRTTRFMRDILGAGGCFLHDPDFAEHFHGLAAREGIAEYYLLKDPPGLLCLRADRSGFVLLVQDRDQVEAHRETARSCGAAPALVAAMGEEGVQPWFAPESRDDRHAWDLHPAVRVGGGGRWACSMLDIPEGMLPREASGLDGGARFVRHLSRH
ncbi:MAG TPA: hypothetical protein VEB20_00385 [Azospirillaceae bacterium]|nr:hypothetical protein [Azospirillaceae bacterium]